MKRNLIPIILMFFILPIFFACSALDNKIAVIPLSGTIQAEADIPLFGGSTITPASVRSYLKRASEDTEVKAIVLQVNSPGGDVSACQEIVYEIEKIDKPIVVSMRTIATSGGYYISAKADKIVALPSTLTGSIGVISEIPNLKGLLNKLGIEMEVIKAGKYKDMYAGLRELTPEEMELMQRTTDQLYGQFIALVAEGRNISKEMVKGLATGQIYTGIEAKELGLVDEIGGLQTAIDLAAKLAAIPHPRIEFYEPESSDLLKLLFSTDISKLANLAEAKLLGLEVITIQKLLNNAYPRFLFK